jgi:uncharacterized protein involved in high-affinity Fe2+ transport
VKVTKALGLCAGLIVLATAARAGEQPAGEPAEMNGMAIRGVFLQAVLMAPAVPGQEAEASDIHLEADIAALPGNAHGFEAGEWVPYLDIDYRLAKKGSEWTAAGKLTPMVASDGPHYGANVKMDGAGEYTVAFAIRPPTDGFLRHVDRETGVAPWSEPFTYEGGFVFAGTGKKGGY